MYLFTCIKHPQNLLSMDTFYVYRNTDQAHTKFMIVTLFRERERKNRARKRMMEEFILNLLFPVKQKFITNRNFFIHSLIHCSQWFPYLFNFKTLLSRVRQTGQFSTIPLFQAKSNFQKKKKKLQVRIQSHPLSPCVFLLTRC